MMLKIELFSRFTLRRMQRMWYFRIVAGNGEIVAQSEGYMTKVAALTTIKLLRSGLLAAELREV